MGIEKPQLLTETYHANDTIDGSQGEPLQGIYEQSASQKYKLGTKLVYPQLNKIFRYGKVGGSGLSKALMTTSPAMDAHFVDEAQATSYVNAIVGAYEFLVDIATGSAVAEDALQDATMVVNKSDGIGDVYNIIANKIQSSDVLMRILLDSPIRTAWAAATEISIAINKYRGVLVAPTTVSGVPVGVPLIDMTTLYYGWFQSRGYAPILADSSTTLAVGEPVGIGSSAGTVETAVTVKQVWGHCVYPPTHSETAIIDLNLD